VEIRRPVVLVVVPALFAKAGVNPRWIIALRLEREADPAGGLGRASRRHGDKGKQQGTDKGERAVHDRLLQTVEAKLTRPARSGAVSPESGEG
jgi:hypothetical protein